jgi:hypothetical protein
MREHGVSGMVDDEWGWRVGMSNARVDAANPFEADRLLLLLGVIGKEVAGLRQELQPLSDSLGVRELSRLAGALDAIERETYVLRARIAQDRTGH